LRSLDEDLHVIEPLVQAM
jgi:hypothetical protein